MNGLISGFYGGLTFALVRLLKMFRVEGMSPSWFWTAYAFKFAAALALLWFYGGTERNKADIYRFWDDSQVIYSSLETKPADYFKMLSGIDAGDKALEKYYRTANNWYPSEGSSVFSNNRLLIRYLALMSLFTLGSYGGVLIITIFLSFTGLFWVFRFFSRQMPDKKHLVYFAVFFTPSVLFWSSGILKESLIWFFTGLILNCLYLALKGKRAVLRSLVVVIAFVLLSQVKAFAALFLATALLPWLYNYIRRPQRPFVSYFIVFFIMISLTSESDKIMHQGVYQMIIKKQSAFVTLAEREGARSLISAPQLEPNTFSFARELPEALSVSLFRPLPKEINSPQMWLMFAENILLLLAIVFAFVFRSKRIRNANTMWLSLFFAFLYLSLIGYSVPVLGAVSRYRTIPLVFLLMALIEIADIKKVEDFFMLARKRKPETTVHPRNSTIR